MLLEEESKDLWTWSDIDTLQRSNVNIDIFCQLGKPDSNTLLSIWTCFCQTLHFSQFGRVTMDNFSYSENKSKIQATT